MNNRRISGCLRWGCILAGVPLALLVVACVYFAVDNAYLLPKESPVVERLSDLDKARMEEALHLKTTLGDQVFPGWARAPLPQIMYNEQYAFLAGYPLAEGLPPAGWRVVPGGERRGGAWEVTPGDEFAGAPYLRARLASPDEDPQAFVVLVGEAHAGSLATFDWTRIRMPADIRGELPAFLRPVFPARLVDALLLGDSDKYISLVLHENAHAYQSLMAPERLAAAEQSNVRYGDDYPSGDPAFVKVWQDELDLLARALRAKDDEEARGLARQFLAQRANRRESTKLDAEFVRFERHREWLEGVARYAEITTYRLAHETPGYRPVAAMRADPYFHAYQGFDVRWNQEIDQLTRMAGSAGEDRFYYTGAAQAFLLDRLSSGWKDRLFEDDVWLEDLLAAAVDI